MQLKFTLPVLFFTTVLAPVNTTPLMAQNNTSEPARRVSLPDTEVHALRSEIVGDDFELWVAHPQAGFVPVPDEPVRVLYLLDANLFFGTAVEMTRLMHKLFGELPPLLVVGITYPTDNGFLQGALRTRDFTPSEDTGMAQMSASFPQMPEAQNIKPSMGGASAFFKFLEDEVKPFVDMRYDVRENGTILFGSSLGGLFVTHTLLTEPTSFDNYIAVSPALWWNQEEIFDIGQEARYSQESEGNVFIAVGGLEESPAIPQLSAFKLKTNAQRMATQLAEDAVPSRKVYFEELDGETHTSVVPVALIRALRRLLQPF